MGQYKNQITILIVDDEEDLCWAFETMLNTDKLMVTTVKSGEEAVEVIRNQMYPIVILDIILPGIDGFETSRIIKQLYPEAVIVMFSGYYDQGNKEIQQGLELGLFQEFLRKPFDFKEVEDIINKYISI